MTKSVETLSGEPLTVGELIDHLSKFERNTQIIEQRYSDYQHMSLKSWVRAVAVERPDKSWITRYHPTMSLDDRCRAKTYVLFTGN